jgi:hypothetical protein
MADVAGAFAALGAVLAAWVGLTTWRTQLRGTAEYELAKRILRVVYKLRDQIAAVRSPFVTASETTLAFKEADVAPDDHADDNVETQLVYQRRWNNLQHVRSDLTVELMEAQILWGDDLKSADNALAQCLQELWSAVLRHIRQLQGRGGNETVEAWEKREAILYQSSDDPEQDEFVKRVHAAVAEFESALRPHVGSRSRVRR